jgi:hypothetical protein
MEGEPMTNRIIKGHGRRVQISKVPVKVEKIVIDGTVADFTLRAYGPVGPRKIGLVCTYTGFKEMARHIVRPLDDIRITSISIKGGGRNKTIQVYYH